MKKKVLSVVLVGALAVTLAACGSSGDSGSSEATEEASVEQEQAAANDEIENEEESQTEKGEEQEAKEEEKETEEAEKENTGDREKVVFYRADDGNGAIEAVVDGFNNSQDEYEVEWVVASSDTDEIHNLLNTSLSAGSSEYDVMAIDTVWAGDFAAAGYIEPLDSYMQEAGRTQAEYNAGSLAAGTYNAKTYALPLYPDFGCLYFRTDIVDDDDAATLVSGDYSWADLQAMAEKYMGEGDTSTGIVFQSNQVEGLVCNANEYTSNFTDIENGLQAMKNMVDSEATPDDILVYQEAETATSFTNGESVFARNWPYQWGLLTEENGSVVMQDQVDIAPLPGGSCIGGWLVAMNANSENKDGAWAFLDYIASGEGQKIFCTVGSYVPGYNALLDDEDVLSANELLTKDGFITALDNTIARPSSDNYDELSDSLQIAIHTYLSGEAELDETVQQVEDLLNQD